MTSAQRLLRMAIHHQHMPVCPHKTDNVTNCLCWRNEVKNWEMRLKTPKTRKNSRLHMEGSFCHKRRPLIKTTIDSSEVTCLHCQRRLNILPSTSSRQN